MAINAILSSDENIFEAFDPWDRRRNPVDWPYNNVPAVQITGRGFTCHENLDDFGLINMNGRMYDPVLGRFLGVDPIVSDITSSQTFNGYSYCYNNPLKYIDPTGYSAYKDFMDYYYSSGNYWSRGQAPGTGGGGGGSYVSGGGCYGGPGCGGNGTGLNGVYYDWKSRTYRSTGEGNPDVGLGYASSIVSQFGGQVPSNGRGNEDYGHWEREVGVYAISFKWVWDIPAGQGDDPNRIRRV